ncbi:SRPBCC family protein [Actinomadura kijaniata]|uniref:SRPBCC family protein n=1 Tax=Actinomadura kijaniata TaxID=46161 RepID=UPI00082C67DB|nr:SRPBCC family protein [Actinomadura kijaniata]
MTARHTLTGRLTVPLPPEEAFTLFTPRGEERWVEGWRPRFPAPAPDDTAPGTVFETSHAEPTTWVVLERRPGRRISYARVTPGVRAGTVTVTLTADGDRRSTVEVTYDLTALTPGAAEDLDRFAADYPAFLRSWQDALTRADEG